MSPGFRGIVAVAAGALVLGTACETEPEGIRPTAGQLEYQQMEMVGFIHFTVNTFTDKEWGYGDEDPALFNPTSLDPEQWVLTAKAGGLKELILTAKHHDGFCLWPSRYTEHSVKNSPYKDGKGDIVREFTEACRKHGMRVGLYLSPWDRNHKDYGNPEYITYYRNQLRELLTNYGEINEIWFDGANGGTGYYGGANEERRIDRRTYYDWPGTVRLVKELQPDVKIFSDAGPDIRWVGNEDGIAGETFWSTIRGDSLVIGASNPSYLNRGDPHGDKWIIGQCDVSIRPGWFYHASQDSMVKTPDQLMNIYFKSVGRNGVFLLNLPPDRRGLIHETDAAHLVEFKRILDRTFETDLAEGARVTTRRMKENRSETYVDLDEPVTFNLLLLQEAIANGQRISRFRVEAQESAGDWQVIARATTMGYKRILRVEPVTASALKVIVEEALYPPTVSRVGCFITSGEH